MSVYIQNTTDKAIPFPYGLTIAGGSMQEIPQDTWRKIFHEWVELGELIRLDSVKIIVGSDGNERTRLNSAKQANKSRTKGDHLKRR